MKILKYRAGIVGCGNIGSRIDKGPGRTPIYTHAGAYSCHPKFQLITAADINKEKLTNFARKWKVKNIYTDFEEMLHNECLDILSICTWKNLHYEIVKKAVMNGVKMIFCEKPFTGNVNEAENLVGLCKKKNVLLAVNYTRRYTKGHQKVKELISDGKLGKIQTVNCLYTKGIINNGSHLMNLFNYFFGKTEWVSSVSLIDRLEKKEDYDLDINLYFSEGFLVSIFCCDSKYYSIFEIDILGTLGRIRITESGYDIKWYKVKNNPVFKGYKELDKVGTIIKSDMEDAMLNAVDNIIESYEKKQSLLCDGQDALETLKIIDLAISSAKENGKRKYYI